MSNNIAEGQVIPIDLNSFTAGTGTGESLVTIKSSRYAKNEYPAEMNIAPKISVHAVYGTTNGKEFSRDYGTGLGWDDTATVSSDGKQLIAKAGFKGISKYSDAYFFLSEAVRAGFPQDKITTDISVFEGSSFGLKEGKNPRSKNSKEKPYPSSYHPEGLAAAMVARGMAGTIPATATTQTTSEPPVSVAPEISTKALEALSQLVNTNGGSLTRTDIPMKLNGLELVKEWDAPVRQQVTLALWDMPSLSSVVSSSANLRLVGETITTK